MQRAEIERFYHDEFGRILATVIRLIGDFHVAEEAVQDAFAVALEQWPHEGRPAHPRAWMIISTARHKAIDALRRAGRWEQIRGELGHIYGPADLLRRLGRTTAAAESYRRALAL